MTHAPQATNIPNERLYFAAALGVIYEFLAYTRSWRSNASGSVRRRLKRRCGAITMSSFAFVVDPICGYDVNDNVDLLSIAVFLLLLWRILRCLFMAGPGRRPSRPVNAAAQYCLENSGLS
jgi:hypothetical protein